MAERLCFLDCRRFGSRWFGRRIFTAIAKAEHNKQAFRLRFYAFQYDSELRLILLAARPGERKEGAPSHQVVADLSEALALLRSRFAAAAADQCSGRQRINT